MTLGLTETELQQKNSDHVRVTDDLQFGRNKGNGLQMRTLATRLHVHATVLQNQIKALVRDIGCLRYWGGNPTASIARPRLIEDVLMCFERKS